jgi:hypothetical protein
MLLNFKVDRVSSNFVSVLQNLIPEAISSQKCHVSMVVILTGYSDMDI